MPQAAAIIPADSDVLCEGCGYVLSGLPTGPGSETRCPECGKPAAESAATLRQPPAWERAGEGRGAFARFIDTTAAVLLRPRQFFRTLNTRPRPEAAGASFRFAQIHWLLSSLLLGIAAAGHFSWYLYLGGGPAGTSQTRTQLLLAAGAVLASYAFLLLLTRLAARLTTWEAAYRGLRLPLSVVNRGLHYHAPHYLPVALATAVTVVGYQALLSQQLISGLYGVTYLLVLCAEVVMAAFYLFKTYWIAMRNMMYANA